MRKEEARNSDIEECKEKIQAILREYNCSLLDFDEGTWVLLYDKDTHETINVNSGYL